MKKLIMMSALLSLGAVTINANQALSYQSTSVAKEAAALDLALSLLKFNDSLGSEESVPLSIKAIEDFVQRGGDVNQTFNKFALITLFFGEHADVEKDGLAEFPDNMSLLNIAIDARVMLTLIKHGANINSVENPILMESAKAFAEEVNRVKSHIEYMKEYMKNNIDNEDNTDIDHIKYVESINKENSWLSDRSVIQGRQILCVAYAFSHKENQQKFLDTYPEFAFLVKAEQK
ncbi:MAG: hypothetical protein NTZ68_04100 [Candidatus Dependentiae bacterium]|nr:hypothetical protein [Candidatus Dependentiae bacterium]